MDNSTSTCGSHNSSYLLLFVQDIYTHDIDTGKKRIEKEKVGNNTLRDKEDFRGKRRGPKYFEFFLFDLGLKYGEDKL